MAFRSASYLKSMVSRLKGGSSLNLPKSRKRDCVPVCMALGMIGVSTSFGVHTAMQQLRRAPDVFVKKSRRKTLPEIVEPEHVAEEAHKFINKSLFRKVAHIQNPSTRDHIYTKERRVETLKAVGVDPKL